MDAGFPCLEMAFLSTEMAFLAVAWSKTSYPTMRRDASSRYAMNHLPSSSSL